MCWAVYLINGPRNDVRLILFAHENAMLETCRIFSRLIAYLLCIFLTNGPQIQHSLDNSSATNSDLHAVTPD